MATSLIHDDPDSQLTPDNSQWACSHCSFSNSILMHPHCEMCEQVDTQMLKLDLSGSIQEIPSWSCPRCTLKNVVLSVRCACCGYLKSSSEHHETVLVNANPSVAHTLTLQTVRERRHRHRSEAEKMFQQIVRYCKEHKTHFVDDQFHPNARSVGPELADRVHRWMRIGDISPESHEDRKLPLTIFSSPQPSDIQQGALGNCWLIAALALVSEQPRLLEHILLTKSVNEQGVYLVRICHNGLWKTIIVDDCFPCTSHQRLVFTQAKRRQLFVPLIEKACAKVFGSYSSLWSGTLMEGLQLLTGAPCDYISLQSTHGAVDTDFIWAKLLSACESQLLMGVSTGGNNISRAEYDRVHIHGNHAFSILAVHIFPHDSSRFVLVRDPHARSQYTEDAITGTIFQQLRQIHPARRSTGAFWISWARFLRYFSSITISTYNSDHFDVREAGQFNTSATDTVTSYRFQVPKSAMVNISLLHHRYNRKTRAFHTQSFVLCDFDQSSGNRTIGHNFSIFISDRSRFSYWSGHLPAGDYILIPFSMSFWKQPEANRDYTVVISSNVQLNLSIKKKRATFLTDCLIAAVMSTGKRKQIGDGAFYTTSRGSDMTIFVSENRSKHRFLSVNINSTIATNVRHSRCSGTSFRTHDSIAPRHRQLVFLTEWADKRGQDSQFAYSYSHAHDVKASPSEPPIDSSEHDLHSPRPW